MNDTISHAQAFYGIDPSATQDENHALLMHIEGQQSQVNGLVSAIYEKAQAQGNSEPNMSGIDFRVLQMASKDIAKSSPEQLALDSSVQAATAEAGKARITGDEESVEEGFGSLLVKKLGHALHSLGITHDGQDLTGDIHGDYDTTLRSQLPAKMAPRLQLAASH